MTQKTYLRSWVSVFTTPIFIVSPVLLEDLIFGPHAIQQLQQSTADAVWDYLQVTDMKNIWVDSSAECCSINLLVWEAIRKSYWLRFFRWMFGFDPSKFCPGVTKQLWSWVSQRREPCDVGQRCLSMHIQPLVPCFQKPAAIAGFQVWIKHQRSPWLNTKRIGAFVEKIGSTHHTDLWAMQRSSVSCCWAICCKQQRFWFPGFQLPNCCTVVAHEPSGCMPWACQGGAPVPSLKPQWRWFRNIYGHSIG